MAGRKVKCKKFRQSVACCYQCGNEDFVMRKRGWFLSLLLMFLTVLPSRRNESLHHISQFTVLAKETLSQDLGADKKRVNI